ITELKQKKAPIDIWGVGTRMVTAYDQPSLDAAYKLGAIKDTKCSWTYKAKRSDSPIKATNPGFQQVKRYFNEGKIMGDIIYDSELKISENIFKHDDQKDLLIPI